MIASSVITEKNIESWKQIHKYIGIIYVFTPTDSDIQEGNYMEEVFLRTEKEFLKLGKRDIRSGPALLWTGPT